jgi:hypothetical protein
MIMQKQLITELLRIFQAIQILNPDSFAFGGRTFTALAQGYNLEQSANLLIPKLQQAIYAHGYCRKFQGTLVDETSMGLQHDENFIKDLTEANANREHWDTDWQIRQILPNGQITAAKGSIVRLVQPGEYVVQGMVGTPPFPGMAVNLFVQGGSAIMQPGFYFVFGEALADQQDESDLVRFYWHISETGAVILTRLLTNTLNRFQVPFRFKCLTNPHLYDRSDAAVLYVAKRYYRLTVEILNDLYRELEKYLKADPPMFSKQLKMGLGFAEDPYTGESFGMSRCRMVAEGIWNAYVQGLTTGEARLQEFIQQFERQGYDFNRPYLNPGSADFYDFPEI